MSTKKIHVNQHIIKANKKNNTRSSPITVKTYKSNNYADTVEILDDSGKVIATLAYKPDTPLSCGATLWIETTNDVRVKSQGNSFIVN